MSKSTEKEDSADNLSFEDEATQQLSKANQFPALERTNLKIPPFAEVTAWGNDDLRRMLNHKEGVEYFRNYCIKEKSEQNVDFWKDCEKLKRMEDANGINRQLVLMEQDYINTNFVEVSQRNKLRKQIAEDKKKQIEGVWNLNIYDELQDFVYKKMTDTYTRFQCSPFYKDLKAEAENAEKNKKN